MNMTCHFFNVGLKTNSRCGLSIIVGFNMVDNGGSVAYVDKMKHNPFLRHILSKTNTISKSQLRVYTLRVDISNANTSLSSKLRNGGG